MKLWFWLNGEKISPLACLRARARKNGITCITDFGPNMLRFFRGANLWLWGHQHETYRDQSVLLGEHISQKFPSTPTYNKQSKQNTHKQSWQNTKNTHKTTNFPREIWSGSQDKGSTAERAICPRGPRSHCPRDCAPRGCRTKLLVAVLVALDVSNLLGRDFRGQFGFWCETCVLRIFYILSLLPVNFGCIHYSHSTGPMCIQWGTDWYNSLIYY